MKNHSISLELPDGWTDQSVFSFFGPEEGDHLHVLTLVVDPSPSESDVAEYAQVRIDQFMESMQGAEILREGPKSLPIEADAYEVVTKWIPTDDTVFYRRDTYLLMNGKGYTFSVNFTKKTLKTLAHEVDQIIGSLTS